MPLWSAPAVRPRRPWLRRRSYPPTPYPPPPGTQVSTTVRDIERLAHAPVGEEERDAHRQCHDCQPDHKADPYPDHNPPLPRCLCRSGRTYFPVQRRINLSAANQTGLGNRGNFSRRPIATMGVACLDCCISLLRELIAARNWLTVFQLPPHASELNPGEIGSSHQAK